jgi:lysophospholipase L1-like esterase
MWWKKTADKMGMNISKINAVSGRRVTTTKSGNTSAVESCTNIGNANVLIVYVGVNDFLNNVALGEYNCNTTNLTEYCPANTEVFTNAYAVMINKIKRTNPGTEIILCTLPTDLCTNGNGESVRTWNARICQLANGFGLKVMDFSGAGASLTDGIHANSAGQDAFYSKAISCLQ